MSKGIYVKWTEEQINFAIAHNDRLTRQQIADALINNFNADTRLTARAVSLKLCRLGYKSPRTGRFEKGQTAWNKGKTGYMGANKTSFKPNQRPFNELPLGSERIDSKDKFVIVKTQMHPPKWRHKHVVLWESVNGRVPDKHVIRFIDGNRQNIVIDNLICTPMSANIHINHFNPANTNNAELNKAIIQTEIIRSKIRELA